MRTHLLRAFLYFFLLEIALARSHEAGVVQHDRDGTPDDQGLTHYVSRPDIRAPKWSFTIHRPEHNSPGHWFIAPYRGILGRQSDRPWVGPMIYDGSNGELVWSGGSMFDINIENFQLSNINGTQLMALVSHDGAYTMSDDYTIQDSIDLEPRSMLNTHELNFVDNSTRVLFLHNIFKGASREDSLKIGYDGECLAHWQGFIECDVTADGWPQLSEWRSYGKIDLDESTMLDGTVEHRCRGWDAIHANSVDKTPEGDYLFSARHTDTIYKISGADGSILWRLGGRRSDFEMSDEMVFTRQHHVRYRGRNETHMLLSIMDNAKAQDKQPASHDYSRGLLFAIDEENMQATLEAYYDHPYRGNGEANAIRRGNYQLLPNGNVLMGWSERAFQSEHTPDGQVVWEAILQVDWMGTYRNYKYEGFVGKPKDPPDVVSNAQQDEQYGASTVVHVSWNGATEVVAWVLHHTSPDGTSKRVQVDKAAKEGFETVLNCPGYAKHVAVDAIDKDGEIIGQSAVITTVVDESVPAEEIAKAEQRLEQTETTQTHSTLGMPSSAVVILVGCVFGVLSMLLLWSTRQSVYEVYQRYTHRAQRYTPLTQGDSNDMDLVVNVKREGSMEVGGVAFRENGYC